MLVLQGNKCARYPNFPPRIPQSQYSQGVRWPLLFVPENHTRSTMPMTS